MVMFISILPVIIIIAIVLLVFYMQMRVYRGFDYQCGKCGRVFSLSADDSLIAPNLLDKNLELKKLVRCPHCGQWTLATHLSK
jgi:DNA-directed RNA polymerase subunit RPC12/RpoP